VGKRGRREAVLTPGQILGGKKFNLSLSQLCTREGKPPKLRLRNYREKDTKTKTGRERETGEKGEAKRKDS